MGLNDELEKTRWAIRIISGTDLGNVDAAVEYLEELCRRLQSAESETAKLREQVASQRGVIPAYRQQLEAGIVTGDWMGSGEEDLRVELVQPAKVHGVSVGIDQGVRVTHLPTGLFAESDTERSQLQNKATALLALKRLVEARLAEAGAADDSDLTEQETSS